jgi:hypothetical protein
MTREEREMDVWQRAYDQASAGPEGRAAAGAHAVDEFRKVFPDPQAQSCSYQCACGTYKFYIKGDSFGVDEFKPARASRFAESKDRPALSETAQARILKKVGDGYEVRVLDGVHLHRFHVDEIVT